MKQLRFVTNPIFLLMMISSFVYVYFFYLADGPARKKEAAEAEMEMARPVPPATNPNAAAPVAGIIMKEENPFNMGNEPGQMNVLNGNQFFNQQNRQDPMALQEENPFAPRARKVRPSQQVDPNAQPVQFQYPNGYFPQGVVPVAGGALGKTWIEAHWIGLEAGPLVPAVAKANNIPPDVNGVFVDEVTLIAADSGLLAGDVITEVNGVHVNDLRSFKYATNLVAQATQTHVTVYRRGGYKNITVSSPDAFGVAQVEGAPMILATDRAPHGYYGPCDSCHTIAPGRANLNQMAKDLGDILAKSAPNIRKGTPAPHGNRGACSKCHVLL
ncbi:MAG TPA: PDZ domain-containing protein [Desulfuromonadales bacterium]|nr:PDZ domain-containing protein [Desulfuromonadales bacterium]